MSCPGPVMITSLVALTVALASCSTAESEPDERSACSSTKSACGGDLTGPWEVQRHCVIGVGVVPLCAGSRLQIDDFQVFGTFTFAADGKATVAAKEVASGRAFIPTGCFNNATCDQIPGKLKVPGLTATCPPGSGGCDCAVNIDAPELTIEGSYETQGTELTLYQGVETIPGSYCVEGDDLWLRARRFEGIQYTYEMKRKR